MTTFDDREREFENRFKHDEALRFKVTARRNKMLGLWAAQRMGLAAEAAETYARSVVEAEFERGGDRHVIEKVCADLAATGESSTPEQIQRELDRFAEQAKQQIMTE